jgi:hypothetical protein
MENEKKEYTDKELILRSKMYSFLKSLLNLVPSEFENLQIDIDTIEFVIRRCDKYREVTKTELSICNLLYQKYRQLDLIEKY